MYFQSYGVYSPPPPPAGIAVKCFMVLGDYHLATVPRGLVGDGRAVGGDGLGGGGGGRGGTMGHLWMAWCLSSMAHLVEHGVPFTYLGTTVQVCAPRHALSVPYCTAATVILKCIFPSIQRLKCAITWLLPMHTL